MVNNNVLVVFSLTDNEPPSFQGIPGDISQNNDPNQADAAVTWVEPIARDNAGEVTLTSNYIPGDNFAIGFTNVTYTAIDQSGNEAISSFAVIVIGRLTVI